MAKVKASTRQSGVAERVSGVTPRGRKPMRAWSMTMASRYQDGAHAGEEEALFEELHR